MSFLSWTFKRGEFALRTEYCCAGLDFTSGSKMTAFLNLNLPRQYFTTETRSTRRRLLKKEAIEVA